MKFEEYKPSFCTLGRKGMTKIISVMDAAYIKAWQKINKVARELIKIWSRRK